VAVAVAVNRETAYLAALAVELVALLTLQRVLERVDKVIMAVRPLLFRVIGQAAAAVGQVL
jgi:hypothetical protein